MILTFKQMSVIFVVSVFLGSAIVWGLKKTTLVEEAASGGVMVEASHYPLRLRMMVFKKTTFELGEPINFTLFLENIGNETVTIHFRMIDYFSFVVYDMWGSKVYELDPVWAMYWTPPSPLRPGLARIAQDTWYQQYNPILRGWGEDPLYDYRKVSPGTYQIVGLFISHTLNFTLETPPITVTIT